MNYTMKIRVKIPTIYVYGMNKPLIDFGEDGKRTERDFFSWLDTLSIQEATEKQNKYLALKSLYD